MQLSKYMDQKRQWIILAAVAILIVLIVLAVLGALGGSNRQISASRLRCTAKNGATRWAAARPFPAATI